jgi:hypothetical protein
MTTNANPSNPVPRRLTTCYIGRPVHMYIDAMAKRRRIQSNPRRRPEWTAEEVTAS